MSKYSLFVEQSHYSGPSTRPDQRTLPIDAPSEDGAVKEAEGLIEALFSDDSIRQIRGHLCRVDGTVLREIVRTRDTQARN